jgi:Kef-type K+ transport system membrane component KefB
MEILYVLLVLLLVTKLCAEVAVRAGQPALIGELVGGVLVGLGVMLLPGSESVIADIGSDETFKGILDLAVFFLMLVAGLEMRPGKLAKAAWKALPVAVVGMLLPLALGILLGWVWLPESDWKLVQSLFLGVALAITAVPVAVKVLMDLGRLESRVGQVVVAAAVLDDIFSLLLLAVLTSMISTSEAPSVASLGLIAVKTLLFIGIAGLAGRYLLPLLARWTRYVCVEYAEFTVVLLFGLGLAVLAEALGMHFLIGAFAAGVLFTRNTIDAEAYKRLRNQFEALTLGFFAPVFFASIGIHLDLTAAVEIPVFVAALLAFAIFGKLVGAGLAARLSGLDGREAVAVGAAMNARGAVEIIIADIALRAGLFAHPTPTPDVVRYLFSAVVIMAIVTTLMSPVMMRAALEPGESGSR